MITQYHYDQYYLRFNAQHSGIVHINVQLAHSKHASIMNSNAMLACSAAH